jgi:hypothetical protein
VNHRFLHANNERGFILVVALMMLVILSLLGFFALNTTDYELQISGNDKISKHSFYMADGGVQAGSELLEQNLGCPSGFVTSTPFKINGVDIYDARLGYHELMSDTPNSPTDIKNVPSDTFRSIRILDDPAGGSDATPHTNLVAWGKTEYLPGSGLQMAAGYEGKGKGAAGAGAIIKYEYQSQYIGLTNSEAKIGTNWFHVIGQEGDCNY